MSGEATRPVYMVFCVDIEFINLLAALGLSTDVTGYDNLTDPVLRTYLESKSSESHEKVSLSGLDNNIKKELRMNMRNTNASSRTESLFIAYHTLLRQHGLVWLSEENQNVVVQHALSAVNPKKLRSRLKSDLVFSKHHLKNDFSSFPKHAKTVSDAFQLVDSGILNDLSGGSSKANDAYKSHKNGAKKSNDPRKNAIKQTENRDEPLCHWEPHCAGGVCHRLHDCRYCSANLKKTFSKNLEAERAKVGPSKSTRSQISKKVLHSHATPTIPKIGQLQSSP